MEQDLISVGLAHLTEKLTQNGIESIDDLCKLTELALTALIQKLKLNEQDAMRLRHLYEAQKQSTCHVRRSEKKRNSKELDDMQHILERYFTEIEDSCNSAKQQIDAKFQEIMHRLSSKQKQLHQHINEWKLTQLENVNQEMSDMMHYQQHSNTNDNEEDDSKQYAKYQDQRLLLQHIESITPLIAVDFNDEVINDQQMASIASIKSTAFVSFPSIVLVKPTHFADKNDGFCIKNIKAVFQSTGDTKKIDADDIVIKYKSQTTPTQKHNDDEKINEAMSAAEWRVFKHGKIALIHNDNESMMQTQLLDVLRFNQPYLCQIEYAVKAPIDMSIRSNVEQFVNHKQELKDEEVCRIPLEYYLHRKHSLTRHPRNLLLNSDTKQYWSAFNSDFQRDERDWILFKLQQKQSDNDANDEKKKKWIPTKILFKNYKSKQDVSKMIVSVGDNKSKQWVALTANPIQPALSKDMQYFDVDTNIDAALAGDTQYRHVKLEFMENHGEASSEMCRFCCRYFALIGVCQQ